MPAPLPDLAVPRTAAGRRGLAAVLADPGRALVASDYDGTLAAVVDDPEQAGPQPGAVEALVRLASVVGTVAVVTGRPAAQAVALGGLDRVPGLVVLGSYGSQRWEAGPGGEMPEAPEATAAEAVRAAVLEVVRRVGPPTVRIELKGPAVAVHVRECPDPAAAQSALAGPLEQVARDHGLVLEPGRLVLELRPPGTDKGRALEALVAERAARSVVFVGDDLGDLAAYRAVEGLRSEGLPGLTVASRSAESPQVADAADLVVDGPPGVAEFLAALATGLGAAQAPGR